MIQLTCSGRRTEIIKRLAQYGLVPVSSAESGNQWVFWVHATDANMLKLEDWKQAQDMHVDRAILTGFGPEPVEAKA